MSEEIVTCGRCLAPLDGSVVTIAVTGGGGDSIPSELRLCAKCGLSLARWYGKRRAARGAHPVAEPSSEEGKTPLPSRSRRDGRQGHHVHRPRKSTSPILRILIATGLMCLLFCFAFFWTWTLIKALGRPVE